MLSHTPWARELLLPKGLSLKPYQIPIVRWMLEHNRSYVFAAPGTGKGVMAPVVAANLAESSSHHWRFVYLCPPFLVENVSDEFSKWAPELFVRQFRDVPPFFNLVKNTVLIVPDSLLLDERSFIAMLSNLFPADCKSFLFVDEASRYKNHGAGRTYELLGSEDLKDVGAIDLFDGVSYLSGSPLENGRPFLTSFLTSLLTTFIISSLTFFLTSLSPLCHLFVTSYLTSFLTPVRGDDRRRDRDDDRFGGRGGGAGSNPVRDPLVDEFRSTYGKSRQWGLADLLGHVVAFCQDQHGSRFIQQRLEVSSDVDKQVRLCAITHRTAPLRSNAGP